MIYTLTISRRRPCTVENDNRSHPCRAPVGPWGLSAIATCLHPETGMMFRKIGLPVHLSPRPRSTLAVHSCRSVRYQSLGSTNIAVEPCIYSNGNKRALFSTKVAHCLTRILIPLLSFLVSGTTPSPTISTSLSHSVAYNSKYPRSSSILTSALP